MAQSIDIFKEQLDRIEAMLLSQKKVLTFEEACIYTGRSRSDMYKKTSAGEVPHFKPEGKMVYFDREELEGWCLRNPVKTKDQIEREASTIVALKTNRKSKAK